MTRQEHHDGDATQFGLPDEEWDLLVDYVGGALPEGPSADAVARRVAADPRWTAAHAALAHATESVRQDLHALGAVIEPMPADLAGRLTAALAAAAESPPTASQAGGDPASAPDGGRPPGRAPATVGPGGTLRPAARPGGPGRRRRRWTTSGLAAAGVLTLVLSGLGLLRSPAYHAVTGAGEQGEATSAGPDGGPGSSAGGTSPGRVMFQLSPQRLTYSGVDYGPGTLAAAAERVATAYGKPSPAAVPDAAGDRAADAALARLTAPAALAACLDAVAREHPRAAVAVDRVDFARYEGAPALVVVFTDTADTGWIWVAGPACGLPGAGADTRHRLPVG